MLQQLKEKFITTTEKSEKFLILTILPKTLSFQKIQKEINVSYHVALKALKACQPAAILDPSIRVSV